MFKADFEEVIATVGSSPSRSVSEVEELVWDIGIALRLGFASPSAISNTLTEKLEGILIRMRFGQVKDYLKAFLNQQE